MFEQYGNISGVTYEWIKLNNRLAGKLATWGKKSLDTSPPTNGLFQLIGVHPHGGVI